MRKVWGGIHFDGTGKADFVFTSDQDDGSWAGVKGKGLFHFDNLGNVDYQQDKDGRVRVDKLHVLYGAERLGSTRYSTCYKRNGEIFKIDIPAMNGIVRDEFNRDAFRPPKWARKPNEFEFGWEPLEVQNRGYYFVR